MARTYSQGHVAALHVSLSTPSPLSVGLVPWPPRRRGGVPPIPIFLGRRSKPRTTSTSIRRPTSHRRRLHRLDGRRRFPGCRHLRGEFLRGHPASGLPRSRTSSSRAPRRSAATPSPSSGERRTNDMHSSAADFYGPRPYHGPAAPPPAAVRAACCRAPGRPPSSRRPSPLSAAPPSLSPPLRAATIRRGCWPSSRVARHGPRLQRPPAARRRRRKLESGASPPGARLSCRPPRLEYCTFHRSISSLVSCGPAPRGATLFESVKTPSLAPLLRASTHRGTHAPPRPRDPNHYCPVGG